MEQDGRDLEIINRHADYLNREAIDVLTPSSAPFAHKG